MEDENELSFTGRLGQVFRVLSEELPPVTLLLGDHYLEYGAMIGTLMRRYEVGAADTLFLRAPVSTEDARNITQHLQVAPFGPFKLVLANLSGASEQAQNILLKVLEEPPGDARFILMADVPPLETIVSRAQVFRFGARLRQDEADSEAQGKVSAAVRAAMSGDRGLLLAVCEGFEARHLAMLARWAASQAGRGRPELSPEGPLEPEVPTRVARRVLTALSAVERARPANAAVTALSQAFD